MTDHDYDHPSEPERAFRRKTTPDDRLSALPDDILLYILSFFRTTDAARTSVLSTRWRYLFVRLPDVDLTFSGAYMCNFMDKGPTLCCHARNKRDMLLCKSIKFINFANRVIMLRKGAPIRKFKLRLASVIPGNSVTIDSLIFAALSCTLQEVDIFIYSDKNWKLARAGLFSCKTLVTLKVIGGEVDLVLPDSVYLPNLKALHLLELAPVDAQSITRLINACPLLEELELGVESHNLSKRLLTRAVDLSCPSLKKLILSGRLCGCSYVLESKNLEYLEYRARQTQQISLDAPNVKYLIYSSLDSINLIQNLKSLVEAKIRVHCSSYPTERGFSLNDLHAFVNGLESVKSLYLYHSSLQALYLCRELLPTFKNLTDLSLDPSNDLFLTNYDHTCLWKVLPSLLKNAPNLEVLIFDQVFRNSFSASEKFECVLPEAIPICSVHHLKEMEIKKFNGEEHEFELVRYFLKNGISLTKMTLCGVVKPSSECCRRILSFWKCSEDCQILFKELDSNRI